MVKKEENPLLNKTGRYHLGLIRKAEYTVGSAVPFSSVYECLETGEYKAFKKGEVFTMPDETELASEDVGWVVTDNPIQFITKNLNVEFERIETFQQHLADWITEHAGRMTFVYFHAVWFALWIAMNNGYFGAQYMFDPYPYGLLTMIVSLEAIFLATFIMVSQNTQAQRSELRAELDYQVNLKAEKEIAEILALLKELKEQEEEFEKEDIEAKLDPKRGKKKLKKRLAELKKKKDSVFEEVGIRDMDA
jgi:uncharacterized membrane protein